MSFVEYCKLLVKLFFKRELSTKEQLYLKGTHIYEEELDVIHILRRIQEIEKLKLVLFNDDQRLLFNLIDKPMIYLDEYDEHKRTSTEDSRTQIHVSPMMGSNADEKKLMKVFEKITSLKRSEVTLIDKRLMDLVEKKLSEFMNNFL